MSCYVLFNVITFSNRLASVKYSWAPGGGRMATTENAVSLISFCRFSSIVDRKVLTVRNCSEKESNPAASETHIRPVTVVAESSFLVVVWLHIEWDTVHR